MEQDKVLRPWDILNKNIERSIPIVAEKRMQICKQCPRFVRLTHQCKECGCIMNIKTKLKDASCPLNKWKSLNVPFDKELTDQEIDKL